MFYLHCACKKWENLPYHVAGPIFAYIINVERTKKISGITETFSENYFQSEFPLLEKKKKKIPIFLHELREINHVIIKKRWYRFVHPGRPTVHFYALEKPKLQISAMLQLKVSDNLIDLIRLPPQSSSEDLATTNFSDLERLFTKLSMDIENHV